MTEVLASQPDGAEPTSGGGRQPHVLLTALGVRAQPTAYDWQGRTETAPLTPLALMRLLPEAKRPERVLVMVTTAAETNTWPVFREEMRKTLGAEPEPIKIPDGRTPDELREILHRVADRIPAGCELSLDVTQGLRHFPFVVYALALYLTSLRGVRLRGCYYGMFEGVPREAPKPIIDLRSLLELPEWFYAVRVFRDLGRADRRADQPGGRKATLRGEGTRERRRTAPPSERTSPSRTNASDFLVPLRCRPAT